MNENIIGYAASLFIVVSFIVKELRMVRIINIIGCLLFVIYGYLLNQNWPIIIPNAILLFIHAYHLIFVPKQLTK